MPCFKKYCFIIFGFVLLPSKITGLRDSVAASKNLVRTGGDGDEKETSASHTPADIEMDYFFGEASLRSPKAMVCHGDELKHECRMTCGANNYGCIFDDCVCLDRELKKVEEKKKQKENLPMSKQEIKMMMSDFEDLIEVLRRHSADLPSEEVELTERPALRHHIAHFCPNLSLARKCIRTCMKVGKPAFCGKDHKCYCGHKYDEHTVDGNVNTDDMYAKFRDLYTKYFGEDGGKPVEIYG